MPDHLGNCQKWLEPDQPRQAGRDTETNINKEKEKADKQREREREQKYKRRKQEEKEQRKKNRKEGEKDRRKEARSEENHYWEGFSIHPPSPQKNGCWEAPSNTNTVRRVERP